MKEANFSMRRNKKIKSFCHPQRTRTMISIERIQLPIFSMPENKMEHITVSIPFKTAAPELDNSKERAVVTLLQLGQKLEKDKNFRILVSQEENYQDAQI